MFRSTLFKAKEVLFKVTKTKCGTIARSTETLKSKVTSRVIKIVPDKGEHHWTHSSPLFQIQQLQNEDERRKDHPTGDFTYRTLKATVYVTCRDTMEEKKENENFKTPKPY